MKEQIIVQNMVDLQKSIYGNTQYKDFDLVELTNIDRLEMENRILKVWPNVRIKAQDLAIKFNIDTDEAIEEFFVNAYILMIKYIRKRHMEWMDIYKPDLFDDIERVKKA